MFPTRLSTPLCMERGLQRRGGKDCLDSRSDRSGILPVPERPVSHAIDLFIFPPRVSLPLSRLSTPGGVRYLRTNHPLSRLFFSTLLFFRTLGNDDQHLAAVARRPYTASSPPMQSLVSFFFFFFISTDIFRTFS